MSLKLEKEYTMQRWINNDHQQQVHHQHVYSNIPKQQQEWAVLLISLILFQYVDLSICHHITSTKRISVTTQNHRNDAHTRSRGHIIGNRSAITTNTEEGIRNRKSFESSHVEAKKRRIDSGQPEEVFNADDRIEANYDEYPMVVPKRAALLLDRLMVALHHALEQERRKLSDFYAVRNEKLAKAKDDNVPNSDDDIDQTNTNHMYSDDDPSVMMDYDFKDLNSINRATGETLMAKSFQRRGDLGLDFGSNVGNDDSVAMLTAAAVTDDDFGGGGVGVRRNGIGNSGRMYWRCYFNAVSCF